MFGLGIWELVIILLIILVVFGVKRLPEIGTGMGEAIKNFKKSYRDAKAIDVTPDSPKEPVDEPEKTNSGTA